MASQKFILPLITVLVVHKTNTHTTPKDKTECAFPNCSKEDVCNGYYNIILDPKYIPKLTSFFKYCFDTFLREMDEEGTFRRHMLLKLLNSATPIIHRSYFDQKTSLKDVTDFLKVKLDVIKYNVFAETMEDIEDPKHKWKSVAERHKIYYAPSTSSGSYSPKDEEQHCQQLLNKNKTNIVNSTDCNGYLDRSKIIRVHRFARVVDFPVVNVTTPSSSEDTSYLILDMYVLVNRCLSISKDVPCAECESENVLDWIRKTVLPHVGIQGLAKVYGDVESVTGKSPNTCGKTP